MSLLALEHVCKRYSNGRREHVVLDDVSLQLEAGELAVVWGLRRSGRSTLLRVAGGIEPVDRGIVRFDGRDLSKRGEGALGEGIGYVQKTLRSAERQSVLEEVVVDQLARGVSAASARSQARAALDRAGVAQCATLSPGELDHAETVRVAIARALSLHPRLLIVDEPVNGVELSDRDGILSLLRSLAHEGVALLVSTGESTGLSGADVALALSDGVLRASPSAELAPVVELRRAPARRASG
jgi:ABC-type lipoprotein export system ATPase subunit